MNLLHKTLLLLLLASFYGSSFASVAEMTSCGVYSDTDNNGDKKDDEKEGEAEPDCE